MISRSALFLEIYPESELIKLQGIDKKVDKPDFVILTYRTIQRLRKEQDLMSVNTLNEFHNQYNYALKISIIYQIIKEKNEFF